MYGREGIQKNCQELTFPRTESIIETAKGLSCMMLLLQAGDDYANGRVRCRRVRSRRVRSRSFHPRGWVPDFDGWVGKILVNPTPTTHDQKRSGEKTWFRTSKIVFSAYVLLSLIFPTPARSPPHDGEIRQCRCCLGGSSFRLSTWYRPLFAHVQHQQPSCFGGWDFGLCSSCRCPLQHAQYSCSSLCCMPPRGRITIGRRKAETPPTTAIHASHSTHVNKFAFRSPLLFVFAYSCRRRLVPRFAGGRGGAIRARRQQHQQ